MYDERKQTALQRAVLTGRPEAVREAWASLGKCEPAPRTLALACRYSNPDVVHALAQLGACFDPRNALDPRQYMEARYEAYIIPWFRHPLRDTRRSSLPSHTGIGGTTPEARREMVRILYEYDSDLSEMLYYGILLDDPAIVDELTSLGVAVSEERAQIITSASHDVQFHGREHQYMEELLLGTGEDSIRRAIARFAEEALVDVVALSLDAFEDEISSDAGARFLKTPLFCEVLEHTNLLHAVSPARLARAIAESRRADALLELLSSDRLSADDARFIADEVRELAPGDLHLNAVLLQHARESDSVPDVSFLFDDDPLSARQLSAIWDFAFDPEGGAVLTGYRGGPDVLIPPRVGTAAVCAVHSDIFAEMIDMLRRVRFPGTIAEIPPDILVGGRFIEEITLQDGVRRIGSNAFNGCAHARFTVPDSVRDIGPGAFAACQELRMASLPAELLRIGPSAFEDCTALDVSLEGGKLRDVGERSFAGTALSSVIIPESVQRIGEEAFGWCSKLTGVQLLTTAAIPPRAFTKCYALSEVQLADGTEEIGRQAFLSSGVQKIRIPDSVQTIGYSVCAHCERLQYAQLPRGLGCVPERAFAGCEALREMQLPEEVHTIESAAFAGCTSLAAIEMPGSVREIQPEAFLECDALTEVSLPDGASMDTDAFAGCTALSRVRLPQDLSEIPEGCFAGCEALHECDIPPSTVSIGPLAFSDSGLRRIFIPKSVRAIGSNAFDGCEELEEVVLESMPKLGAGVFAHCGKLGPGSIRRAE